MPGKRAGPWAAGFIVLSLTLVAFGIVVSRRGELDADGVAPSQSAEDLEDLTVREQPGLRVVPAVCDFGVMTKGSANTLLRIENAGLQPVRVGNIRKACGCFDLSDVSSTTTFEAMKTVLDPGKSIPFRLQFNTKAYRGSQKFDVAFYPDPPNSPPFVLTVKAFILSAEADLGVVAADEATTRSFSFPFRAKSAPLVESVRSSTPGIAAKARIRDEETDLRSLTLEVETSAGLKAGPLAWTLDLFVRQEGNPLTTWTIPVKGYAEGPISVSPKELSLGIIKGDALTSASLTFSPRAGGPCPEIKCKIDGAKGISVRWADEADARRRRAIVTVSPQGMKKGGGLAGQLRFEPQGVKMDPIVVPLQAIVW